MKIVVRGTNWIGDSVMSVPALRALRRVFPDAEITLHTRSWAEGIFRDADFIDRLLTYDRPGPSEVLGQARALRAERFDLAIVLPNSFASALTVRFAGIPRRFGYSANARGMLLTDSIPVPEWKDQRHEVYYYLSLIEEVERRILGTDSVSSIPPDISISLSDARRSTAQEFLTQQGLDIQKPLIAIGAGSTNSRAKRWPAQSFARLIDRLFHEFDPNVVLLGGPEDGAVSQAICEATDRKPLDLTGKTSLANAAALLGVFDLLISNDMGLAHLAPAVGTKTLVIFGPSNPVTTRPFSPLAEILRAGVECSPCMLRDCPIDHRCMTRISAEYVLERVNAALNK